MTRFILTRHGHVEGIEPPQFRGRKDLPLTEKGRREAQLLATALGDKEQPAIIYTSPLSRCVETGRIVAEALGVEQKIIYDLIDLDYGNWTGMEHASIERTDRDRFELWWTAPQFVRPPNGESLHDLFARVGNVIRELIERHRDDNVLLVAHDSTNRAALLTFLDLPLSAYWRLAQNSCAISQIEVVGAKTIVGCINETRHLIESKSGLAQSR